jgi:hypothetical protein
MTNRPFANYPPFLDDNTGQSLIDWIIKCCEDQGITPAQCNLELSDEGLELWAEHTLLEGRGKAEHDRYYALLDAQMELTRKIASDSHAGRKNPKDWDREFQLRGLVEQARVEAYLSRKYEEELK